MSNNLSYLIFNLLKKIIHVFDCADYLSWRQLSSEWIIKFTFIIVIISVNFCCCDLIRSGFFCWIKRDCISTTDFYS